MHVALLLWVTLCLVQQSTHVVQTQLAVTRYASARWDHTIAAAS